MSERVKVTTKAPEAKKENSVSQTRKPDSSQSMNSPIDRILFLQRTIGNQAVQRLFNSGAIQAKLRIGQSNDKCEQEADRVADKVMKMEHWNNVTDAVSHNMDSKIIRRAPESPYSMSEGRIIEEDMVQTKSISDPKKITGPSISARVDKVLQRPGKSLPKMTRIFMESRFGYNFNNVRIHSDNQAAEAAQSINARAFTKGNNIVFAQGQYLPQKRYGLNLLAHELTHTIQQGKALEKKITNSSVGREQSPLSIQNQDRTSIIRRIKWNTARDTGSDSYPWGSGPKGDVFEVETDAGRKIPAWKPHNGTTYWCHGYTFGGSNVRGGPFSFWGQNVPQILNDDGWQSTPSCLTQPRDILVFRRGNVTHTGIVHSFHNLPNRAIVDENRSMLNSKPGQRPFNRASWLVNIRSYGKYRVYSKNPAQGPCQGLGKNEL